MDLNCTHSRHVFPHAGLFEMQGGLVFRMEGLLTNPILPLRQQRGVLSSTANEVFPRRCIALLSKSFAVSET